MCASKNMKNNSIAVFPCELYAHKSNYKNILNIFYIKFYTNVLSRGWDIYVSKIKKNSSIAMRLVSYTDTNWMNNFSYEYYLYIYSFVIPCNRNSDLIIIKL